jgi:hypothetical protein
LFSEVVVNTGYDYDELVSGIGSLGDEADVVGGLPGLNMPNNKTPPVPCPLAGRVLEMAENSGAYITE